MLQNTVVLCVLKIKLFAANDTHLSSSKTTSSISTTSYWRGATLGTVRTVSTIPDFFDQDEFFGHFIWNMKMSFIFHIKFQIQ